MVVFVFKGCDRVCTNRINCFHFHFFYIRSVGFVVVEVVHVGSAFLARWFRRLQGFGRGRRVPFLWFLLLFFGLRIQTVSRHQTEGPWWSFCSVLVGTSRPLHIKIGFISDCDMRMSLHKTDDVHGQRPIFIRFGMNCWTSFSDSPRWSTSIASLNAARATAPHTTFLRAPWTVVFCLRQLLDWNFQVSWQISFLPLPPGDDSL